MAPGTGLCNGLHADERGRRVFIVADGVWRRCGVPMLSCVAGLRRCVASARCACLGIAVFLPLGVTAAGTDDDVPDGWFVWPMVEPADGAATDVSALNGTAPAGAAGWISVRDGHFVLPDGKAVRFWGCNLDSGQAFPDAASADEIARVLAKGGVNIARLHHLDNAWGSENGTSLWPKDRPEHRELDPVALDKVHRLMAALKARGIYTNFNLKVSKTLVAADGFPESVSQLPLFQKRIDLYDRRMIELQKDYARRLLTTVNPYTGLAPVDDPALAIVEINNENSLLGYFTRDLGRDIERFAEPFRSELVALWNAWLVKHHGDDASLRDAWADSPAAAGTASSLLASTDRWLARLQPGTEGSIATDAATGTLRIEVSRTSGVAWHLQVQQRDVHLEDGTVYTVTFQARTDTARTLQFGVGLDTDARSDEPWRSFGLLDTVTIGTDWTPVRVAFVAHSVAGAPGTFSFNPAGAPGTFEIRGLRMFAGNPDGGLRPGQSAADGTVPIPLAPTRAQWADWIAFLADTDRAFAEEMRAFLRDELGVKTPIVCSQLEFGGITALWREQSMDFADAHVYWQHPVFPASGDWDRAHWTIENSPQLTALGDRSFAAVGQMALNRVANKPFSLSEYDHAAPTDYACEMYPLVASFGARQDWDAVYPYAVGAYGTGVDTPKISTFFDQQNHPAKWGLAPFATLVFRHGLVQPAPVAAVLRPGTPLWAEATHADILWGKLIPEGPFGFLDTRFAMSDRPLPAGEKAQIDRAGTVPDGRAPLRLEPTPGGVVYVVDTPAAAGVVGHIGGSAVDAGVLHVSCGRFGRDFAAVTAVSLDGQPLACSARILVTIVGRAENLTMGRNAERTSVGNRWGRGPTIVERVPATLTLDVGAGLKVFALAPDGTRAGRVTSCTGADGEGTVFSVGSETASIHFEVVR